jgi:hypothetical protein
MNWPGNLIRGQLREKIEREKGKSLPQFSHFLPDFQAHFHCSSGVSGTFSGLFMSSSGEPENTGNWLWQNLAICQ